MPDPGLPIHFFTIVLNGEPFIRYHLDVFRRLPFRWHWHIVEGVASLAHDTAWSISSGGRVDDRMHSGGLSIDGTSSYLDSIAAAEPERISLYRKEGAFWDGKREMVDAPLVNVDEECLLWEVDADELWTGDQFCAIRQLFLQQPDRTAAYYWCQYVPAPGAVIATRYNYAENPAQDWLRTWRYRPGDRWLSHEPPVLARPADRIPDLGKAHPFLHDETEAVGAVFQHFAYATEAQVRFKETYYGYVGALDGWHALRDALARSSGPLRLGNYFPWVTDDTLVDNAARRHVRMLAREQNGVTWRFGEAAAESKSPPARGPIVVDGVFFQHGLNTGIARVWRSVLREWIRSEFAEDVLLLERAGAGPRLEGLPTRSLPLWDRHRTAEDAFRLQRVCDEERAALFVSTYYTAPISTPSVMVVYDMIPERLALDMSDPVWQEKRLAIEHASAYACISENTRRDLQELAEGAGGKPAVVVPLGVDDHFFDAHEADAKAFRERNGVDRPYLLVVGDRRGVDGYKNVRLLFRALRSWSDARDHEVVCVGGAAELEPELVGLAPRTRTRRFVLSDDELRGAYAGAVALVFPSLYEGFGLPVAEALAAGCPVITTPVSSLPEVGGDAVIYIDPDDEQALVRALGEVREPQRRAELIAAGKLRADRFRWPEAAASLATALRDVAVGESADAYRARERVWEERRSVQARTQERTAQRSRSRGPEARTGSTPPAGSGRRLKALLRRHLPPSVVEQLLRARSRARRIRRVS